MKILYGFAQKTWCDSFLVFWTEFPSYPVVLLLSRNIFPWPALANFLSLSLVIHFITRFLVITSIRYAERQSVEVQSVDRLTAEFLNPSITDVDKAPTDSATQELQNVKQEY